MLHYTIMQKDVGQRNYEVLSLISELCQVVRCCRQDAVFCEDVTFTQFLILDHVASKGDLKMSELHTIFAVDKSTTTRLVTPAMKRIIRKRPLAADCLTISLLP